MGALTELRLLVLLDVDDDRANRIAEAAAQSLLNEETAKQKEQVRFAAKSISNDVALLNQKTMLYFMSSLSQLDATI